MKNRIWVVEGHHKEKIVSAVVEAEIARNFENG